MKTGKRNQLIAVLLCLSMLLGMLTASGPVLAANEKNTGGGVSA